MYRILSLCLIALALVIFAGAPALAQGQGQATGNTHEGTIVSATANQIVMKDKAGKEMTHQLAPNARVLVDGKESKVADLKPGLKVRITTKKGDEKTALKVEALDKNKTFGSNSGTIK
jgi:hypothetical protein